MKYINVAAVALIGCSLLAGCGKHNNSGINEKELQQVSVDNSIAEKPEIANINGSADKNELPNEEKLADAPNNSTLRYGTIDSEEENTSISFWVNDNKIDVSGYYRGEAFEKKLSDDNANEFINEIVNYSPNVQEKEYDYWPHTEEYPEMLVLFRYDVTFENGYRYRTDGALCYPDGWAEFVERLFEIIDK